MSSTFLAWLPEILRDIAIGINYCEPNRTVMAAETIKFDRRANSTKFGWISSGTLTSTENMHSETTALPDRTFCVRQN